LTLGLFTTKKQIFHNNRFSPFSHGQNQKIPTDSNSPYRKTPGYKKSADLHFLLKIQTTRGKKFDFSLKNFPNRLIFCIPWVFFVMGNTNMKEFFDFDHGKVEKIDRCEKSTRDFLYRCEKSFASP
jgi:hypothetical protein